HLLQDFQTLLLQPLKRVRGRSWLEGSSPQYGRSSLLRDSSRFPHLIVALDGTGPGHYLDCRSTKYDALHFHNSVRAMELTRCQLEGTAHMSNMIHSRKDS